MKNKYRIELDDDWGHVRVNNKKWPIIDAAYDFYLRMLNTMRGMDKGVVSKAIEVTIKEVEP